MHSLTPGLVIPLPDDKLMWTLTVTLTPQEGPCVRNLPGTSFLSPRGPLCLCTFSKWPLRM